MALDLIIRNVQIADGTGSPLYTADIAVTGDQITEIGDLAPNATAERTIDGAGYVASPGFIDIHTHADIALMARPEHHPKVLQGVTTEVFTNCGLGFAPVNDEGLAIQKDYILGLFGDDGNADNPPHPKVDWKWRSVADFLERYEKNGIGANLAYLMPHGSVRVSAMGMAERPASADELETMRSMIAQGMDEGAWGLSTGIWYAPMRSADRQELVTICKTAGFFATHQRDYGEQIWEATRESLDIAKEAGVPVQIAHLQMNGPSNAGRAGELLELLEGAVAEGIDVTVDTYPYTAGSTFVQSTLPAWAVDGGPDSILRRLSEPETRAKLVTELALLPTDWSRYAVVGVSSPENGRYEGMTFPDIAQKRGMSIAEWICAVLEEDSLKACFVANNAHENNIREILQWSRQMVGSDGLHLPGKTHPRLYGTFPRILGHYVRNEKVISLVEGVRKMTSAPAERIGLKRRGKLQKGNFADIVLFNPDTVIDRATYDDPLRYPDGIDWVFVNGKAVKANGVPTGELAGRVLRKTR